MTPELPRDAKPVCLMDAQSWQCRYIVGPIAGPKTIYCGAQVEEGSSYCPHHRALCYHPARSRAERTWA